MSETKAQDASGTRAPEAVRESGSTKGLDTSYLDLGKGAEKEQAKKAPKGYVVTRNIKCDGKKYVAGMEFDGKLYSNLVESGAVRKS